MAAAVAGCAGRQDLSYTRAGPAVPQLWPVEGAPLVISSGFGSTRGRGKNSRFHKGIDLPAPRGAAVIAAAAGTVITVASEGAYGRYVVIDHESGYQTLYAHLLEFAVRPGDRVGAGQMIGRVGKTGNATGYHLHYEVHRNGQVVDPIGYVPR
jgi:murein DD-endopeptidase MepM/ murein hydrolase activator NlpD